jgi:hypothetical protein
MGLIAAHLVFDANNVDATTSFAVFHLADMLHSLKEKHVAGWHGEVRGS